MSSDKLRSWADLTSMTKGEELIVERVRLAERDIAIEGQFELPRLVQLSTEDQIFIMAFVKAHGSIKEMEEVFGLSYPSIKNRLNKISEQFTFIEERPALSKADILKQLERGEISTKEALERIKSL
ncbi:MAG: DUF2089 family protein [Bdellovibrio sp.]